MVIAALPSVNPSATGSIFTGRRSSRTFSSPSSPDAGNRVSASTTRLPSLVSTISIRRNPLLGSAIATVNSADFPR